MSDTEVVVFGQPSATVSAIAGAQVATVAALAGVEISTIGVIGLPGPPGPPGPGGGVDEVWIGTSDPIAANPTIELWFDPDAPSADSPIFNVQNFGAKGDGTTNDLTSVRNALTAASGSTLLFPAGTYVLSNDTVSTFLTPGAKTTIRGEGADKTVLLVSATTAAQRSVFAITADDISFAGVTVRRTSDFASLMFAVSAGVDRLTFTDSVFDGGEDLYTTAFTHGITIPETGAVTAIRADNCTWSHFDYPWLQNNTSVCAVTDVRFRNCRILDFVSGGLSFNAPIAENRDIVIDTCRFVAPAGRIAAAFAHVTGGVVSHCYFKNAGEAVHVEDYSTAIRIESNEMDECAETATTPAASGVITVIDSNNVKVNGNTVRNLAAVAHTSRALITVVGNPTGNTAGGRPKLGATYDVTVLDNQVQAGPNLAIQVNDCAAHEVSNNTLVGGLVINPTTFAETGVNAYAGLLLPRNTLVGSTIKGNRIRGFLYGIVSSISAPFSSGSFHFSTVIANNTIVGCRHGIIGNNTRPATFQGNTITGCLHPLTIGATGNGADGGGNYAYVVTGNTLHNNKYRASMDGGMVIVATGTAAIGTAVTLNVEPLLYDLSGGGSGKLVQFSGGGVLTTTVTRPSASTTITGDVTGAAIAAGEVGWVTPFYDRANEAPFTVNTRVVSSNADTVAGVAGALYVSGAAGNGFIEFMQEQSADPAAPAANGARFFTRDNGSGKTQACVRFATGAVVVFATEP